MSHLFPSNFQLSTIVVPFIFTKYVSRQPDAKRNKICKPRNLSNYKEEAKGSFYKTIRQYVNTYLVIPERSKDKVHLNENAAKW